MLNTINSTLFTAQKVYNKPQQLNQAATSFPAKFNTGQLAQDTVCFTGSKEKRAHREAEAKELKIPERFEIPLNEVTYHHINAVKAGLDPRTAETYQVAAAKLGLDPMNVTAKDVAAEPHKRDLEIDAKLLGIKTEGVALGELGEKVKQVKCDIHREVVEEVLGKVPENYQPLAYANFDNILKSDVSIEESLQLIAEHTGLKNAAIGALKRLSGNKPEKLSTDRRAEIFEQYDDQNQKINRMTTLFNQRVLGIREDNPDTGKVDQKAKMVWNLRCRAADMKRADFEKRLSAL